MRDDFVKSDRNISNPLEGLVKEGEELEVKHDLSLEISLFLGIKKEKKNESISDTRCSSKSLDV